MTTVPFLKLDRIHEEIKHEIMEAFEQVYDDNWFLLGKQLAQFEVAYAEFTGVRHCMGVSNGLDALRIALMCLKIGPGDEVIVPANSFIASALAIIHCGATPVFVDPDPRTYNITAESIEEAISPRTKAIMPVHLYGQPCEMNEIIALARKKSLFVVEDNAQGQGAHFKGKRTGSWGHINATSFYPGKNLGALGDAGAITTLHESLAKEAGILRNYGAERKYMHTHVGFNMRMDECQAAFLLVKLKRLLKWTEQRRQIANWYNARLRCVKGIQLPFVHPDAYHVYHLYVIKTSRREALQQWLAGRGISTLIHYPVALHREKIFEGKFRQAGPLTVADSNARECLSLPLWVGMEEDHVDLICHEITKFFS